MNELVVVGGMAAVTILIRYPILALVSRVKLSDEAIRALRYVPVAVLTAIIIPGLVLSDGEVSLVPSNAYLYAGILSAIIAWRTRNLLATIGIGMLVFFVWRAVFGG